MVTPISFINCSTAEECLAGPKSATPYHNDMEGEWVKEKNNLPLGIRVDVCRFKLVVFNPFVKKMKGVEKWLL